MKWKQDKYSSWKKTDYCKTISFVYTLLQVIEMAYKRYFANVFDCIIK